MAKCNIIGLSLLDKVAAMGKVPAAGDLTHYVPLTGREPQLHEAGAVWVIQIKGDVLQRGNEIWTDPTCVVTENDFGWFATGPVTDRGTGEVNQAEQPAVQPDRALPPLAP